MKITRRYWTWYLLPVTGLAVLVWIPVGIGADGKPFEPRDLALATLGGQIGFLALVFAIVTFVADTGVLSGTRGTRALTESAVPYFAVVLASTTLTALCVVSPSELFARITVTVAVVIAMALPYLVIRLGKSASPASIARRASIEIKRRLMRRDWDLKEAEVEEDLNDLRAAAILQWTRGDLAGCKVLIEAFIDSIPLREDREMMIDSLPQFRLLSMWIEIHGDNHGSLLFLANQLLDKALDRIDNDDVEVAERFIRHIDSTVAHTLDSGVHAEYKTHALRIMEEMARKILLRHPDKWNSLGLPLVQLDETIARFLVQSGSPRSREIDELAFRSQVPIKLARIEIESATEPTGGSADTAILESVGLVELLRAAHRSGLVIPDSIANQFVRHLFDEATNLVRAAENRVAVFGLLIPHLDLMATSNELIRAQQFFNQMADGLKPDSIDTGAARYVQKCMEVLHEQNRGLEFNAHVLVRLTVYVASGRKSADMVRHLGALLRLLPGQRPDVARIISDALTDCLVALMEESHTDQRARINLSRALGLIVNSREKDWRMRKIIRPGLQNALALAEWPETHMQPTRILALLASALLVTENRNSDEMSSPELAGLAENVLKALSVGSKGIFVPAAGVQWALRVAERMQANGARRNSLLFLGVALEILAARPTASRVSSDAGDSTAERMLSLLERLVRPQMSTQRGALDAREVLETVERAVGLLRPDINHVVQVVMGAASHTEDPDDLERLQVLLESSAGPDGVSSPGTTALVAAGRRSLQVFQRKRDTDAFVRASSALGVTRKSALETDMDPAECLLVARADFHVAFSERRMLDFEDSLKYLNNALRVTVAALRRVDVAISAGSPRGAEIDGLVAMSARIVSRVASDFQQSRLADNVRRQVPRERDAEDIVGGVMDFMRYLRRLSTEYPGMEPSDELARRIAVICRPLGNLRRSAEVLLRRISDESDTNSQHRRRRSYRDDVISELKALNFELRLIITEGGEIQVPRQDRTYVLPPFLHYCAVLSSAETNIERQRERILSQGTMEASFSENVSRLLNPRSGRPYRKQLHAGEARVIVEACDAIADTFVRVLTDGRGLARSNDHTEKGIQTALFHLFRALESRHLLGIESGYSEIALEYLRALGFAFERSLLNDESVAIAQRLVFGDWASGSGKNVSDSIIERLLGARGPRGSSGTRALELLDEVVGGLLRAIVEDKSRRDVSSAIRARLRAIRNGVEGDSAPERLLDSWLALWNPFGEFKIGEAVETLLPASWAHVPWMQVPDKQDRPGSKSDVEIDRAHEAEVPVVNESDSDPEAGSRVLDTQYDSAIEVDDPVE